MNLKHTNKSQDDILTSCEEFGGWCWKRLKSLKTLTIN